MKYLKLTIPISSNSSFYWSIQNCLKENRIKFTIFKIKKTGYMDAPYAFLENKKEMEIYTNKLIKFCKKENSNFVLPFFESEIYPILKNYEKFSNEKIKILTENKENFLKLHLKHKFYEIAKNLNVRIPPYKTINSLSELTSNLKTIKYPIVVRPTVSVLGIGCCFCRSEWEILEKASLLYKFNRFPLILQKPIKKMGETIINLISINGKIVDYFIFSSVLINKKMEKKILEISEKILKKIKWNGCASPQFIHSEEGLFLLEINPRLSYSIAGPGKKSLIENNLYVYNLIPKDNFKKLNKNFLFMTNEKKLRLIFLKEFFFIKPFDTLYTLARMELLNLLQKIKIYSPFPENYLQIDKNLRDY